jgi:hypothetical protein
MGSGLHDRALHHGKDEFRQRLEIGIRRQPVAPASRQERTAIDPAVKLAARRSRTGGSGS